MIQTKIETLKKTRKFLLQIVDNLSIDQLNETPEGFSNNIIWNLGHLIAAQEGVCYIRSGITRAADQSFILEFKPGTRPERYISGSETERIKQLLTNSLDQLQSDYESNIFLHYDTFTTRYGVEIKRIEDAIDFLSYHEGLHGGYIMALKRVLK